MGRIQSGCKGCMKRYPGCHGECESYREFRAWIEQRNAEMRKDAESRRDQVMFISRFLKELHKGRRTVK